MIGEFEKISEEAITLAEALLEALDGQPAELCLQAVVALVAEITAQAASDHADAAQIMHILQISVQQSLAKMIAHGELEWPEQVKH